MNPIDDFLEQPPSVAPDIAQRDAILRKTTSLLPPRRRSWRVPIALGIAASVLIVIAAFWWYARATVAVPQQGLGFVERKKDAPPPPVKEQPQEAPRPMNALELEWTAFDAASNDERAKLYFQAGDLYFNRHRDLESAVRCYQQAIQYSSERGLEIQTQDNYLLTALKMDHRKEK